MRKLVNLDRLSPEEVQFTPRRARHVLTEPVPKYELPASGYIIVETSGLFRTTGKLGDLNRSTQHFV